MPAQPNFPQMELETLAFWKRERIFEQTLAKKSPKGDFVFYEGPPTANGKPGIHHIESRAYKDAIPRFKTMQGYHVERRAGWDTHGLPVELQVEKALKISGKKQIESLKSTPEESIAFFNQKCRESVWEYLQDWVKSTERIGFWLDLEHSYVTYHNEYIETLWGIIKRVHEKGLLEKDYKVVPYCPRCGTPLSSHELAQGYDEAEDPSVYIKFLISNSQFPKKTYFLVWTTTPWTLPGNVALAVKEDADYVLVEIAGEYLILAKARLSILGDTPYTVKDTFKGKELIGLDYEPLYTFVKYDKPAHYVAVADFVSLEDGTGVVHTAVMYGADDFELGDKLGLPKKHLVDTEGRYIPEVTPWAGLFVKDADPKIIKDLNERGLLYRQETITHTYPFCWRCRTPLIYYARDSWFIRMSKLKDRLIRANKTIHWVPAHVRDGRFGEFLRELKDWSFSRERYWGTPLPIWICDPSCGGCGEKKIVGSFAELPEMPKNEKGEPDVHRPFIDRVTFPCGKCKKIMRRVKEVCDVWFDSGSMPFAQYAEIRNKKSEIGIKPRLYPADYISEAADQTRGWFYTLLAVATLLDFPAPYKNVIVLGILLDKNGKKMSKSRGNVIDPEKIIEKYGADALRWWMYTVNQPLEDKRFDERELETIQRQTFMILWNVLSFYKLYAPNPQTRKLANNSTTKHIMDSWLTSKLNILISDTTDHLEHYRLTETTRGIADFITDLSTWYVRRSRERFKSGDQSAVAVLGQTLETLARLMAPFTPFLAEKIFQSVIPSETEGSRSVHLTDWPKADKKLIDEKLLSEMQTVREIAERGHAARAAAKIRVRQPLAKVTVMSSLGDDKELVQILKDELNVKSVELKPGKTLEVSLDTVLTDDLRREGYAREIIRTVNDLRKQAQLHPSDRVKLHYDTKDPSMIDLLTEHAGPIHAALGGRSDIWPGKIETNISEELNLNGSILWLGILTKS